MEIIYQQVYQRSEILIRKQAEIAEEIKKLEETRRRITLELEAAMKYLQTGVIDGSVRAVIQKLNQLKKDVTTNKCARAIEAKSHIVIRILQEHGAEGLDTNQILALIQTFNAELSRKYLTAILGKLRKRQMVTKTGRKFFVTEPRTNPRTLIASNSDLPREEVAHA